MKMKEIEALESLVGQWPQDKRLTSLSHNKERRFSFFYHLVQLRKPALSLEIGCHRGLVSAYMCASAGKHGGHVAAIDKRGEWIPLHALPGLFDNFHYILKDSREAGPDVAALAEEFGPIGVVWQDSSHLYNESVAEWDIYTQFLDKNAVWVCDDLTLHYPEDEGTPGIMGYWTERPGRVKKIYWQPSPFRNGADIGIILL